MAKFQAAIDYDLKLHSTLKSQVRSVYNRWSLNTPVDSSGRPVGGRIHKFQKKSSVKVAAAIQNVSPFPASLTCQLKKLFPFLQNTENDWAPKFLLANRSENENRELRRKFHLTDESKQDDEDDSDNDAEEDGISFGEMDAIEEEEDLYGFPAPTYPPVVSNTNRKSVSPQLGNLEDANRVSEAEWDDPEGLEIIHEEAGATSANENPFEEDMSLEADDLVGVLLLPKC